MRLHQNLNGIEACAIDARWLTLSRKPMYSSPDQGCISLPVA